MDRATSSDLRLSSRALRRFLLTFLLACGFLSVLYASRDRITSYGYSDLLLEESIDDADPNFDYVELNLTPPKEQIEPLIKVNAKACQDRRDYYKGLLAAKSSARKLKIDENGKLYGRPFVFSETPLSSDTCYSFEEIIQPLRNLVDDSVNLCNAILQPQNRTTLVIRLEIDNLFTEDAVYNMRRLIVEVGWALGIDINILQIIGPEYNPDKVPVEFQRLLTNYQRDDAFNEYPDETQAKTKIDRIGLKYEEGFGSHYATAFYQFPQIWYMQQNPYTFAYFIDSHARHTSSYGDLMEQLQEVQDDTDFLTLDPILLTRPSNLWGPNEASLPESYYHSRMIFHGISSNMVRAMKRTLLNGVNAPHEGFMPAVAIRNNLKIAMYAHPVLKKMDDLLFQTYSVPEGHDWTIHNLKDQGENQTWQYGGTFSADAVKWVDDLPRTKWIDTLYQSWRHEKQVCLPGLLVYPVSGR